MNCGQQSFECLKNEAMVETQKNDHKKQT